MKGMSSCLLDDTIMNQRIAPARPVAEGLPELHTPAVYGASPLKPFLYRIPVTGKPPIRCACEGSLPEGLVLDESTGIISGSAAAAGEYPVRIKASNALGEDTQSIMLRIAADGVCRTPLLGWTSWNACRGEVSQEDIRNAARLLVSTGLADYGYQYVNIDSGWQGAYGGPHNAIQTNGRFPDLKALAEELHGLGLKLGIYSTPMQKAWGGTNLPGCTLGQLDKSSVDVYFGIGLDHRESNNVRQWTDWGIDYLKYDWAPCDIPNATLMKDCLLQSPRDFAFCVTVQAGKENVAYWKTHCSSWRDNVDSTDTWENVKGRFSTDAWAEYCNPGHFFDLDMLETGFFDNHACRLTEDEQLIAFSIRALFPSPIQISCDLAKLTAFDLSLLCNPEILAVNQDSLGSGVVCIREQQARTRQNQEYLRTKIYARLLADGDWAVGLFNIGETVADLSLNLATGAAVRDLWAREDLPMADQNCLTLTLAPHSVRVVRIRGELIGQ
jgi:alpha-galactosidase